MNKDAFVKRSIERHGNKAYSYEAVPDTVNAKDKVSIICPKHGEFDQRVSHHLKGQKCKKCSLESRTNTREEFINKSNKVHGTFYDYNKIKSEFVKRADKVSIICPEHGEFVQLASNHLNGLGCYHCGMDRLKNFNKESVSNIKVSLDKLHNGKYSYAFFDTYESKRYSLIEIVCPEHGIFKQKLGKHLSGAGCQKCNGGIRLTYEEVLGRLKRLHPDLDYSKFTDYRNMRDGTIIVGCKIHGDFATSVYKLQDQRVPCPECKDKFVSSQELKLQEWLSSKGIHFTTHDRKIIEPHELDLVVPGHNLAIEVNGVYWHSIEFKDEHYHYNKWQRCLDSGIRLLQFYDVEIDNQFDMITGIIERALNNPSPGTDQQEIIINNRLESVLDYPEHVIIEELHPEIDEFEYFKAWNAGHTKLKYCHQNRF